MTHPWRIRINDRAAAACGAGVLVSARHVLTCAHVVADGDRPGNGFAVTFPGSTDSTPRPVRPVDGGWFPMSADGRGDLAVLELDGPVPADVSPAPLGRGDDSTGHPVIAFGHPPTPSTGLWTRGVIIGSAGPGGEWLQVSGVAVVDRRIEPGFSGAGVFDEERKRVVGIVVAALVSGTDRIAWMVPLAVAARYWTPLADLIQPPPVAGGELSPAAIRRLVTAFAALRTMADDGTRQQVVESLPEPIGGTVRRHRAALPDTHNIVTACLEFDGGLGELTRAVRHLEGPTRAMRTVDALLDELGVGVPS